MRRSFITVSLAATIAVAGFATILPFSPARATPDFNFTIPDPVGDTFGLDPVQHDIVSVSGSSDGTNFVLTVEFADTIAAPDSGSPIKLGGFVTFDTDQNLATGVNVDADIAQFCPQPLNLGAEANLAIFAYAGGTAPLLALPGGAPITDVPITFDTTSFTAVIPLSALGGDELFNFAVLMGGNDPKSDEEITDCAPDDGGFIDTAGIQVTPTATTAVAPSPTGTATLEPPAPTATAAARTLPVTGANGGGPSAPWLPWLLLGAGTLGSLAGIAALSRRRATDRARQPP